MPPDPLPDYYQNLPSYIADSTTRALAQQQWKQNPNLRQINWDNLYAVNRNNFVTVDNIDGIQGNNQRINESQYILGERVQDQKHFDLASTYNTHFDEHISLSAGLSYQFELSENYDQVGDLLGGQYWLNLDQYAYFCTQAVIVRRNWTCGIRTNCLPLAINTVMITCM